MRDVAKHLVVIVPKVEQLTKLVFKKSWPPSVLKRAKRVAVAALLHALDFSDMLTP